MKLHLLDVAIIVLYLLSTIFIGLWYRKKARENKESYMLGGKSLPWYKLGLSDASDMFDISGTMWMVSLCFVYGMKSIWIPWLWPVFNQVFLMMYLSRWLRRSNAATGAEWLATRFGKTGPGVTGSNVVVIAFALLSCFGFLAYGFIGLGKFIEIFIPWDLVKAYVPFHVAPQYVPHMYGIIFTLFAMFYSIIGGMHSIVLGDMIKYGIMTVACVWISFIAAGKLSGNHLNVPDGWYSPFFGKNLGLSWTGIINEVNNKIKEDGYSLFGLFFMMMTFKGFFAAVAGPAPNYDMQKILSTRSPEEASKMSGFVNIILLPIRYSLIVSLTILGVLFYHQMDLKDAKGAIDFERILPAVINNFLPVGLVGLLLAGLLGAFMSTFSGTMNAAQAYIVNDIYLKYINPKASTKKIITANYLVGVFVVAVGVILGFFVKDVNSVLQWIVSALYGGYIASNVLKWHWWRFNANGFFYGMLSGILSAMIFSLIIPSVQLLYWFPVLFAISLGGSVIGSYATAPTDMTVLRSFYTTVRPWGFWGPVKALVMEKDPSFVPNKNFKLNMFNVVIGTITQCCLTILPMYLILAQKTSLIVTVAILVVTITILKKTWWNKFKDY
ncbi:Na+:solute symporter [Mucilaginibacter rubeus]|uniref:Na+:solute symporter n=1 Tax=Mucilaginibacter rubeus TaxID=2027860 RepID=A0AAE6JBR7_9SPHI|nr:MULTISPECIES: sodium:solute symporter family protein [Mucilaginibacter]QEM02145.1 Na+:solute symporter [Mucilaginibacter rubeus]QEM14773.1 Na+:solute symporter [Mucilaginibacter gossypii]QTE42520.1 Na+:solute symporter [Mucilaginibacter rubeus]QTE49123.1 Na+:solute symporter [Mucilaginibacter rubeus]QTE54221.1 Na+:solute symporter [Mucilaginibacter rubeus]